jgi:hypothetical protein
MSLPPETENPPDGRGGRRDTAGGGGLLRILQDQRIIWLFLAAAAIHSVVPAQLLLGDWGGGSVPGIAILFALVFAIVWLVVVWGLVAVGAMFRRTVVRAVVLVLLLLPYPFEISMLAQGIAAVPHLRDDPKTGRGFFDSQTDRELGAAIWACDWSNRNEGVACDLDKITALTAKTDTSKVSSSGTSLMWWAISNGANPDVLRIVLRGGKPPADVSNWLLDRACCDSSELPLLRAALDGGVDPNTQIRDEDPYMPKTFRWPEGLAAYLDAGARIDEPDRDGYTPLMRAIAWREYEAAELLIARGAAEDRVALDGTTMEALLAAILPGNAATLPPGVRALADRHRSQ